MTDAELLAAYRATTWTVRLPGSAVPLRLGESFPAPPGLLPAGIITAYNPASVPRGAEENRAAQARLRRELEALGACLLPAEAGGTGLDADLWTEPGFLVRAVPREEMVSVAQRFGQNAIVWIDPGGEPSLVATRAGFAGALPGDTLTDS